MKKVIVLSKNNTFSGVMKEKEFNDLFVFCEREFVLECLYQNSVFSIYKIYGLNSVEIKQMIEENYKNQKYENSKVYIVEKILELDKYYLPQFLLNYKKEELENILYKLKKKRGTKNENNIRY